MPLKLTKVWKVTLKDTRKYHDNEPLLKPWVLARDVSHAQQRARVWAAKNEQRHLKVIGVEYLGSIDA